MRKTISILVLVAVLFATITMCKTEKKVAYTSQNKFLFTATKKGYTNIVKLNTTIKTKLIIASIPLPPDPKEILYAKQERSYQFHKEV